MSKRYFINNFDTFLGKALVSELLKEEVEQPTLMATYQDITKTEKPKGFKKILKREKPKLSRKKMLEECDVYVYDLHSSSQSDISFVVESLKAATLEENKVLVLISDIMVWANTAKKEKIIVKNEEFLDENQENRILTENPVQTETEESKITHIFIYILCIEPEELKETDENMPKPTTDEIEGDTEHKTEVAAPIVVEPPKEYMPFQEEHYKDRVSHIDFQVFKDMEDMALALTKENLKVIIICAGILYGKGEILLHRFLQVYMNIIYIYILMCILVCLVTRTNRTTILTRRVQ